MDHDHSIATTRIEAFSDGILAIIVTLLVLDLRVPDLGREISNQAALGILLGLLPQFVSFALTFFIVCIFWVNHHQFFHALKYADRKLLWLNNILLFWLSCTPFTTAFLGRHPTNMVSAMLFGSVLFFAAMSFSIMSHHAMFDGKLMEEHISLLERTRAQRRSYWGIVLYGMAVVLAPVSVYIALAIFIIVPLIYFVPQKIVFS